MALPALPPSGSTSWYAHYAAVDGAVRSGTDLFFDAEKVQDAVAAMIIEGSGLTKAYDDTTGNLTIAAPHAAPAKRTITGNYTLVLADATDMVLHSTAGTALTITLPSDTVAVPLETVIPWRQFGAGQITFAAGSSASVVSRGGVFKSAGQYAEGVITKVAASTWLLSGDISA